MEANQSNIIKQAAEIILVAKKEVKALLDQLPLSNLSLATEPALQAIINRLFFLSGTPQLPETNGVVEFPPVTNFMGEEITYPKQVKLEDIKASDYERTIFLDKVTRLYGEIISVSPQGILNSYTLPEDILVLRGVAKKAGIEGFEEREINLRFIEDIAAGILAKEKETALESKINAQLNSIDHLKTIGGSVDLTDVNEDDDFNEDEDEEFIPHTITEEDLKVNPELVEQGLKVGDVIDIPLRAAQEATALAAQQNVKVEEPAKESPTKEEPATESKKKSGSKK